MQTTVIYGTIYRRAPVPLAVMSEMARDDAKTGPDTGH